MQWLETISNKLTPEYKEAKKMITTSDLPTIFHGERGRTSDIQIINKCVIYDLCFACAEALHYNGYDVGNGDDVGDITNTVSAWYIADNFRFYKQVYVMNNVLYDKLIMTKGLDKLTVGLIQKLPFSSFYIDFSQCNQEFDGVFICIENVKFKEKESTSLVAIMKIKDDLYPLMYPLDFNETVEDAIKQSWEIGAIPKVKLEYMTKLFKDVMQVIFYMCTVNPDVVKRYTGNTKKKIKGKSGNKKPEKQVQVNDIGLSYRVGTTLGKTKVTYINNYASSSDDAAGTGTKKRPHFRSPHWHTYYKGKGKSEMELKWVDLIYVNGEDADDEVKPITLHNMR